MNLEMTGRHVEITPALREFAEEKLAKLDKLLDGPLDVHVVLEIEKHRHIAEIQVKSGSLSLASSMETGDLYASIGEVADKLERLAVKHKDKRRGAKKHRVSPRDPDIAAAIGANAAAAAGGTAAAADEVNGVRIVRTPGAFRARPMSTEDAARELHAGSDDVLVYRDAGTERLCVVYRLDDGAVGLVDPEG